MAVAHDFFDRDSRSVIEYEMLTVADRHGLPRDLFSLFCVSDIFARSLDDSAEIWDVWRRLQRTIGPDIGSSTAISAAACARAREAVTLALSFKNGLSCPAAKLLDRVLRDNDQVAVRLHAVNSAGRLALGLRAWLAAAAIFHWNRVALAGGDVAIMSATMVRVLSTTGQ